MKLLRARPTLAAVLTAAVALTWSYQVFAGHGELPNRIPEAAPYHTGEAQFYPPPYNAEWEGVNAPSNCDGCHETIFGQWNGSMMSNSWRDPGWRGAFLLIARLTAKDGNCDTPNPPDGTAKAQINPFANGDCTSTWDLGTSSHTTSGSGSLLDDFCSRCHMPANYIDNIPLSNVSIDPMNGLEHGLVDPNYDPTSDNGTGFAFAELASQNRNTEPGRWGIFCEVCHTMAETRHTPFHNYQISGTQYVPALGTDSRDALLPDPNDQDMLTPPDVSSPSLGYTVGAGSYRLSPHAIHTPERFGPLTFNDFTGMIDPYVSDVFNINYTYQQGEFSGKHDGFYNVLFERAEMCAACHDVTNPLTIKNQIGNWVGGFPIERTYTEWMGSRYADRPGNANFDPNFKRDCLTCHMQQNFDQPGTAQTLYDAQGNPLPPVQGEVCRSGPVRPAFYTHHFVGGNAYVTRLIGADIEQGGTAPYPELSVYSHSSADKTSRYSRAVYENVGNQGARTHHDRMAWERLQHVLDLDLTAPASAGAGTQAALTINLVNSGTGHNFPSGFPEGRNAWVAVRAFDLATDTELEIQDSFWNRTSVGVGYLTDQEVVDPSFPGCNFKLPAGSPDPYARQFKAVASLGDGCPTLELPYAAPLNLVTNAQGLPIDAAGVPIDRSNPLGLPRFTDLDGDGDVYDDSFLVDSRLRPLPHPGASVTLNRYSVVIPPGTQGPIAVTAAVYYQSFEAIVAEKFLGNLADTDEDFLLEPCILKGACDGRTPTVEPAVVEGSAPVLMEMRNTVIDVTGGAVDTEPPALFGTYPENGAIDTYLDTVPKIFFNEPVSNVDESLFTLTDDTTGLTVPGFVRQVGDGSWAFFPGPINLGSREDYTATVAAGVCDHAGNCTTQPITWSFRTARNASEASGNTSVPIGFGIPNPDPFPTVDTIVPPDGEGNVPVNTTIDVTFSEPVENVDTSTFRLNQDGGNGDCSVLGVAVSGTVSGSGATWTFTPAAPLAANRTIHCVTLDAAIVSAITGASLNDGVDFTSQFKTPNNP